ncbi:MAG: M50 family metallopeptidase [Defluviitaleaceae bacterium]|nr:M50 family metallopeptidase [Defluviitaleaceae bacterium]
MLSWGLWTWLVLLIMIVASLTIPWFLVMVVASIFVHEVGHLIFGWLTGYRFLSFGLSIFVLCKEGGKLKFKIVPEYVLCGHCHMIPPENETHLQDFEFVWYNLGGGVFEVLLLIVLIRLDGVLPYHDWRSGMVSIGIVIIACSLLWNLAPIFQNDGQNIWKALNCKAAKRGLYLAFYMPGILNDGIRYSELDSKLFYVSDTADFSDWRVAYIVVCQAAHLYDLGEYDKSIACYEKLKNYNHPDFNTEIELDHLYYYTIHSPDYGKARTIFADNKVKKALKKHTRIVAAYEYFVNGDKEKGKELLQKAKDEAMKLPDNGTKLMEMDYCAKLEDVMEG